VQVSGVRGGGPIAWNGRGKLAEHHRSSGIDQLHEGKARQCFGKGLGDRPATVTGDMAPARMNGVMINA